MNKIVFISMVLLFMDLSPINYSKEYNNFLCTPHYVRIGYSPSHNNSVKYYDLTNVLPHRFVKDGSIDYTRYLQKGIDEYRNVMMPDFPVLVNAKGLKIRSNSMILFQKNSELILKPTAQAGYSIMKIYHVNNVEIYGAKLLGDRDQHVGTVGEWGMGFYIAAAENVKIDSSFISNCWGDGIYIGGENAEACDNIRINNSKIDSCRRNGISLTNGKNIQIINCEISNTNGTPPMSGIDIEPNNNKAIINNILIRNLLTRKNRNCGILIVLNNLPAMVPKETNIVIDHPIDKQSTTAIRIASFKGSYIDKKVLLGRIEINDPQWYDNKKTLVLGNNLNMCPSVSFKNIRIYRKEKSGKDSLMKNGQTLLKMQYVDKNNVSFK